MEQQNKVRYSDEELEEFKEIILKKIEIAKRDYQQLMDALMNKGDNGVDDTMPCLLYTSPSPRDGKLSRMPSSA